VFSAFIISPTCVTCSNHLTLLHLFTLIMFGEDHKFWSSSLCNSFNPLVTSSAIGQLHICLNALFSCSFKLTLFHYKHETWTGVVLCIAIFWFLDCRRGSRKKDSREGQVMKILVQCQQSRFQRGSSDEDSSRGSRKEDSREVQVLKTPVEGRAKKTDPSSRQGICPMTSTP
jgi:hypothetical protein